MEPPRPPGDGRGFRPRGKVGDRPTFTGWPNWIWAPFNKPPGTKVPPHLKDELEDSPSQDDTRPADKSPSETSVLSPSNNAIRAAVKGQSETFEYSPSKNAIRPADKSQSETSVLSPSNNAIRAAEKGQSETLEYSPSKNAIRAARKSESETSVFSHSLWGPPAKASWNDPEAKSFWSFEGLQSQLNGYKKKYLRGRDIIEKWRTPPGHFEDIGAEAKALLMDGYLARNFNGNAMPTEDGLLFCLGTTLWDREEVRDREEVSKIIVKGRWANTSLFINAARFLVPNQAELETEVVTKLTFHDILGPSSKGILHLPYPYEHERFEIKTLHRYAGVTAGVQADAPCTDVSVLLGTYLFALGGKAEMNVANRTINLSCGGTLRTKELSACFLMHWRDNIPSVEATLRKEFENSNSIAFHASHSFRDRPWAETSNVTFGASHSFPSAVTLKGRVSSTGIASVLVKKTIRESFSVILSTDVGLRNVGEVQKVGILLSFQ